MSKVLIHDYEIYVKGVSKKIIYQFSDVHLNLSDELSSEEEKAETESRIENWHRVREKFAMRYGEPYGDDQKIEAEEHFENLLKTAHQDGDALIITGDVFDHLNEAHFRFFENRFVDLGIPYVYACGNHEYVDNIPSDTAMAMIKRPVQTLDLGDLVIMAFENSKRVITKEQIDALKTKLSEGKPIIVAMHVPIQAEHNEIHKKCSEYFRLNYDGCPAENLEFIDLIYKNADKIAAILAGHLHFLNVCELTHGLTQYVSTQGITGNINRIVIGE
ncbi:MAG: hypothetical protein E7653_02430 [Ruminococcaceae bacterium]|nr:hypothetical protein [Oscillospiraceae bacterium]